MNLKEKVFEHLDKNPKSSTEELRKLFPSANKKSLWNYSGQWRKKQGLKSKSSSNSIRSKVFGFFDKNPEASMKDLRKAFPTANEVSISNYRYQWRKQKVKPKKKKSIRLQVFEYVEKHPTVTFGELKKALPNINPSSISAYHSQWKQGQKSPAKQAKAKTVEKASKKTAKKERKEKSTFSGTTRELVDALNATIAAQKETIETMKAQNTLLKDQQTAISSELEELTDEQQEEIKKIMITYIKGMRKL